MARRAKPYEVLAVYGPPPPPRQRGNWIVAVGLVTVIFVAGLNTIVQLYESSAPPESSGATAPTATASTPARPDSLRDTLSWQADAVAAGDEAAWLAPVDPTQPALVNQYKALYTRLRAIGVTGLEPAVVDAFDPPCCRTTVYYGVCLQVDACPGPSSGFDIGTMVSEDSTESFLARVDWHPTADGHNMFTAYQALPSAKGEATPPLLAGEALRIQMGHRVLVAAPPSLAVDLPAAVRAADAAATVADRYANWQTPLRYIVYLAGPSEWRRWFGGPWKDRAEIVAYAINDTSSSDDVVVNFASLTDDGGSLDAVLRHEFGHVVSLLGSGYVDDDVLTEGFAEFVEENGRPVAQYDGLPYVRAYLNSHSWNGNPDDLDRWLFDNDLAAAAYGIGYLTWRCIASQYGLTKMIAFAGEAVHYAQPHDAAARKALGVGWSTVAKGCESFIRSAAG